MLTRLWRTGKLGVCQSFHVVMPIFAQMIGRDIRDQAAARFRSGSHVRKTRAWRF